MAAVCRSPPDGSFKLIEYLLRRLDHASIVRMVFGVELLEQLLDADNIPFAEFLPAVINSGQSLLRDVVTYILNKSNVVNFAVFGEGFLDGPDFLGGEEDPEGIEESIECKLAHFSRVVWVELLDAAVALLEVVDTAPEQLELEFVIHLHDLVHPIHFYNLLSMGFQYRNNGSPISGWISWPWCGPRCICSRGVQIWSSSLLRSPSSSFFRFP